MTMDQWAIGAMPLAAIWIGLITLRARRGDYLRNDLFPELAFGLTAAMSWPLVLATVVPAMAVSYVAALLIEHTTPGEKLI